MSRRVMPARPTAAPRAASSALARKCDCGNHASGGTCSSCAEEQKKRRVSRVADAGEASSSASTSSGGTVPSIVHDVLRGGGQPMPAGVRAMMEPRFGADFSDVRLHTDGRAAQSSRAVQAQAYTAGPHIVFDAGRYQPETPAGQHLIAHELTHVVQQRGAGDGGALPQTIGDPADASEREADATADRVLSHSRAQASDSAAQTVAARGRGVQRLSEAAGIGLGIGLGALGAAGIGVGLAALFGAFDKEQFTTDELITYLDTLATTRAPVKKRISDNMARDVVRHWLSGVDPKIDVDKGHTSKDKSLSAVDLKRLLILEMLDGSTGDADEEQIIAIVARSTSDDVMQIFDPAKGLGIQHVDEKVNGKQHDELMAQLEAKFPASSRVREQVPAGNSCNARDSLMIFHAKQRALEEVDHAVRMLATPDDPAVKLALDCYFRGASTTSIATIRGMFERIQARLPTAEYACVRGMASGVFNLPEGPQNADCVAEDADALKIPPTYTNAAGIDVARTVFLCDKFFGRGGENQATTLIHETAHRSGVDDRDYLPKCGYPLTSALDNADSYSQFASALFANRTAPSIAPASAPATTPASAPTAAPASAPGGGATPGGPQ